MVRLFKHYIPHAVLLLGVVDALLLFASAEIGWVVRAHQIRMAVEPIVDRLPQLLIFVFTLQIALVAVGAYGVASFLSLRFAAARLAVAISLGVILQALLFFPRAQPDLLAVEPALFDGAVQYPPGGRPRAARPDAGWRDVQAPGGDPRRRRARRADPGTGEPTGGEFHRRGLRRDG